MLRSESTCDFVIAPAPELGQLLIEKLCKPVTFLAQSDKQYKFLVKWADFSDKYTSWEPEEHFDCSPHLLLDYINKLLHSVDKKRSVVLYNFMNLQLHERDKG